MAESVKLVVVGDAGVGKTCLLLTFTSNTFPKDYAPTDFFVFPVANLQVAGKTVALSLWDTPGQEDYDRLRPLSYPQTSVFLLCFSVVSEKSFKNIKTKWWPEVTHYCPTKNILVGTQVDLRDDPSFLESLIEKGLKPVTVTAEQGDQLSADIKALQYMECSALTQRNLHEVFEFAIKSVIFPKEKPQVRRGGCTLF